MINIAPALVIQALVLIASWVRSAQIHHKMPDKADIWEKYKYASDHHPVSVEIVTA
jgi:hypothetical protein